VIALFTLALTSNVSAQDANNPWAVGFGVNTIDFYNGSDFGDQMKDLFGNKDWNVLPSISRITAEKYLDKGFSLQLAGSVNKITSFRGIDDVDFLYYSLGANVKYDVNNLIGDTSKYFDPFVYLGGDFVSADSRSEGMLNIGVGFNTWFNENLGLSFQTGTKKGFSNQVRAHYQSSLGLVIKFGGKDTDGDGVYDKDDACPEVAGLKEFNGCPDADGDGIKDSDDACPNVAGLAAMNGCPDADGDGVADKDDMCPNEKGTKANKGCPDTDGDGVVDKDDKCPNVAGPSANNGCPWPDTDGDGVLDKDDKCVDEAGPASNNGCPEEGMSESQIAALSQYSILFATDRANVTKVAAAKLDKVYDLISPVENVIFVVEGYADNVGADKYNQYLSERRAESVKAYLVEKGFDASRLEVAGFGENNPAESNKTAAGRSKNRRVVIKLSDK
jgi:outer membrane protein OmpA-like peptidoglycan-associated protein